VRLEICQVVWYFATDMRLQMTVRYGFFVAAALPSLRWKTFFEEPAMLLGKL
jgi:hypothetical protein